MSGGWIVTNTDHLSCSGCLDLVNRAITTARVTGSVGATQETRGVGDHHGATVRRITTMRFERDDLKNLDPTGAVTIATPNGDYAILGDTYNEALTDTSMVEALYDAATTEGKPLPAGWKRTA